jgi:UDP-N-acetyl-D-mannosaminuronate dehydrogenase
VTSPGALGSRLEQRLKSRSATVGVVGLGDVRLPLEDFLARGAQFEYADPRVPQIQVGRHVLQSVAWAQADLPAYELVVLLTAHPEFEPARLVGDARLLLDTRNATGALGDFRQVIRI